MDSDELSLRNANRHTKWTSHSWSKLSFCCFSLLLLSWVRQKSKLKNRTLGSHYSFCELTKRDELSLRMVLALPNASIAGLASMIWSSKDPCTHNHPSNTRDEGTGWWTVKTAAWGGWENSRLVWRFPPKPRRWQSTGWPSWCLPSSLHQTLH